MKSETEHHIYGGQAGGHERRRHDIVPFVNVCHLKTQMNTVRNTIAISGCHSAAQVDQAGALIETFNGLPPLHYVPHVCGFELALRFSGLIVLTSK